MCSSCSASQHTNGLWRTYDPACIYCGARMIQQLGKLRTPSSAQITERRRNELAIWVAHGHDEATLRTLAKGKELAYAPVAETKRKR